MEFGRNKRSSQSLSADEEKQSSAAVPRVLRIVRGDTALDETSDQVNYDLKEEAGQNGRLQRPIDLRPLGGFQRFRPAVRDRLGAITQWLACSLSVSGVLARYQWRAFLRDLVGLSWLCLLFIVSYFASYYLRFDGAIWLWLEKWFLRTAPYICAVKLSVFFGFRIHRSWGRFLTFSDLLLLVEATTLALAVIVVLDRFLLPPRMIPRGILLIDWGTTLLVLGGCRAVIRAVWDQSWHNFFTNASPVLIAGADEAGEELLRALSRHHANRHRVVGFLDRDPNRLGTRIGGIPVVGTFEQACEIAKALGVKQIFLAGGALTGREVRRLLAETSRAAIEVKILPSYEQLLAGKLAVQPRPIAIEDLLRRDPVMLELDNIRHWLEGRTLLVTGSAGSIGSEIARQLLRFSPKSLVLLDRSETGQFFLERELRQLQQGLLVHNRTAPQLAVVLADVLDTARMQKIFREFRPDIVFHAAAYKHVPLMESHPGEAVKNIVLATKQVADLAARFRAESFVMISTDKAVNPTSVMGACKRLAEMYVQSMTEVSSCRWVTVRFGNVLDSAGSVVQIFRQQIAEGGPVTVTDPRMERFFMTIPEAAGLVIQAGVIGESGQIMVLDMGDPVKIVDLAADMIRLSGLEVGRDIEIRVTGLRPGEKLFEELQATDEQTLPTRHKKIRIALGSRVERARLLRVTEELRRLADEDPQVVVSKLKQVVPGYGLVHESPAEPSRYAA
ncbi:MAG: polysaccharide biosynthesis protein [Thermogutta sp.]